MTPIVPRLELHGEVGPLREESSCSCIINEMIENVPHSFVVECATGGLLRVELCARAPRFAARERKGGSRTERPTTTSTRTKQGAHGHENTKSGNAPGACGMMRRTSMLRIVAVRQKGHAVVI